MPLTAGTITCRTYYVAEPPSKNFLAEANRDIHRHSFQPVRPDHSPPFDRLGFGARHSRHPPHNRQVGFR